MTVLPMIAAAGLAAFTVFALFYAARGGSSHWTGAAIAGAALLAYSLFPIAFEGPLGFVAKHLQDWWGVQIWLDLLCAIGIAWLLFVPRARVAGMSPLPWLGLILLSGSIGFFAAIARLLWLERTAAR